MAAKCVLEPEEVEQLVLDAIRKIQENKQRADVNSVCKTLSKKHGLDDSTTSLQITMMIATGQVQTVKRGGAESLRVCETQVPKRTKKDKIGNENEEKFRKISDDEARLAECRAELQDAASPEDVGRREKGEDRQVKDGLEEEVFEIKSKDQQINKTEIEQRFAGIEQQISKIFLRLDREGEQKVSAETEAFLLQRENLNLKDENLALRLEIDKLKDIIRKNSENRSEKNEPKKDTFLQQNQEKENIFERMYLKSDVQNIWGDDLRPTSRFSTFDAEKEDPWQFPKRTTKPNHLSAISFETANRFNTLENYGITNNKPFGSSKTSSTRKTIDKEITSQKTARNVVPGEHSYADALILNQQTAFDKINPQHASPKGAKSSPYAHKEAFEIRSDKSSRNIRDSSSQTRQNSVQRDFRPHRDETSDDSTRTEKAVNNQPNTQTNTASFRRFNRKRPTVSIVGDSIIKGIRKQEINRSVRQMNTFVKTFPGATTNDMESYIVPTLNREPDYLIIHCGTNDLRKDEPDVIAKKITKLAINSKKTVRNVAVSSILARGDSDLMEGKRLQVNSLLEKSLAGNQISFIRHETLDQNWRYLLFEDGIHLNNEGTNVLGSSFVNYLNTI